MLSEDASFNLLAGKDVIANPTQLYNLANNGQFDPTAMVEMIEKQQFGLIIYRAQFYPYEVLLAIADAYEPTETVEMNGFEYVILRPKSR